VTLVVNGAVARTVRPQTQEIVFAKDLPPLPWSVETRSPSGRVLSQMTVRAGDASETNLPGGGREVKGDAARVDLSCVVVSTCGRVRRCSDLPLGRAHLGDCDP